MNAQEKKLMENPEHKPLMDLPPVIQQLMRANIPHLLIMQCDGNWASVLVATGLERGCIYAVASTALVDPPPVQYKQYPLFCGSDRIYKVVLTQPNSDSKGVYHLLTVTGMAEFAGIRYKGSQEWKTVLDTVTNGEPVEVRLRVR